MRPQIEKFMEEHEDMNNLYHAPKYRKLKYWALAIITTVILLLFATTIWTEELSPNALLIIRGCAGLGAIIYVVLVGILTYRVNSQHIKNRNNNIGKYS